MTQLRLTIAPGAYEGDLARAADGTLLEDDGIETLITLLLFTDARCNEDEVDPGTDLRGWWWEAFDDDGTPPMGSKAWRHDGKPLTDERLQQMSSDYTDALAPLVSERIAISATATVTRGEDGAPRLTTEVYRAGDTEPYTRTWERYFALQ